MKRYLLIFLGVCLSLLSFGQTKVSTTSSAKGHDSAPKKEKPTEVNIYIDNTGSMWGFFKEGNDFDFAISSILTQMRLNNLAVDSNIHVFFINGKVIEYKGRGIVKDCKNPKYYTKGKVETTEVSSFFEEAAKYVGNNVINVIISDFVISPGRATVAQMVVAHEKNAISLAVNTALNKQKNLAIAMYRLTSEFNGNIYDCNDSPFKISGESIPYYMWVMADSELLKRFRKCVPANKIENSKGGSSVTNNYVFFSEKAANRSAYIVSTSAGKKIASDKVKGAQLNPNGFYRITIGVNLSAFTLLGQKYLTEKSNYQVSNPSYKILSIKRKSGVMNSTHEIVLETKSKVTPAVITISLKDKFPNWISKYNISTNDCDLVTQEIDKTYGILTIAQAVKQAYHSQSIWESFKFSINK